MDVHGRRLEDLSKHSSRSLEDVLSQSEAASAVSTLNRAVYMTAPGATGQSFGKQPRFAEASASTRFPGQDAWYDSGSASGLGTVTRSMEETSRLYASPFTKGVPARPKLTASGSAGTLGPGSYSISDDVACGGIVRMRETFRPTASFHDTVGGKFGSTVAGGDYGFGSW